MSGEACVHCGYYPKRAAEAIVFEDGNLALYDRKSRTARSTGDPNERMRWHGMLTAIQQQRRRSPGWVYHSYLAKFGEPPPVYRSNPIPPTPEVEAWVRSRDIAYAKAMRKQKAAGAA